MSTSEEMVNGTSLPPTRSPEQIMYQSAGAIVAAIVIGVIIIFTLILTAVKLYNRHTRTEMELKSKSTKKVTTPNSVGQSSFTSQPTSLTSIPQDIHLANR
ncbi:noncompact myelin-associated protein [Microcaecilia unicolor]|uniref:Noncompact myelin-associated protein n=1 Tax=Microcaecilia unicolor TaxID=1415580 RepID=A0A6P7ZG84_9AMPH|nr:noncompact myelin-associated protein [Microcaecilia unicolor]XP_030074421.1 noncompact myelin-associated protein [Microcaecilia unicolor]